MSRSIKKGPFADTGLLEKIEAQEDSEKKQVIRTWSRRSIIFPSFVGFTIVVYDGRKHMPVYIIEDTVGHELGESVPTRAFRGRKTADKTTITVSK